MCSALVIARRGENCLRADEMHANARLIAAAPDLLDALRSVLEWDDASLDMPEHLSRIVKDAIAKATGEPQ